LRSIESNALITAGIAFVLFVVLGALVARRTPTRIDVEAVALRGNGVGLASLFTRLGYWPAVLVASIIAAGIALLIGIKLEAVAALIALQALSQTAIVWIKPLFRRTRPDYWIVHQESDLSFPSGHSATGVVLYVGFAGLAISATALPHDAALALAIVLAITAIGIAWSRLVLGAHYLTDVLGGSLFGFGSLSLGAAILAHIGFLTSLG